MKDTKEMLARQVTHARAELDRHRERITFLESEVERAHAQAEVEARRRSEIELQRNTAWRERDEARQHPPLFERMSFEKFTRAQLVSFIEQAINEARRKGMVEAEGLLSRHRELTESTDLEMMRGVVQTYQARIAVVEADQRRRQEQTVAPVKLDARPLTEKLQPAGQPILPTGTSVKNTSTFRAPGWWSMEQYPSAPLPQTSYVAFDERAKKVEAEAKAKNFTEGSRVPVKGTHGGTYILERHGDVTSCSCPAWQFAKGPTNQRTCKHLENYLGAAQERERIRLAGIQRSCWCGRAFASCKAAYDTISIAQRKYGHQPRLA